MLRGSRAARRPDLIDRVTKTLLADDPRVHAALWDMISTLDLAAQLGQIGCPTLILVGEQDPSSPPGAARVLRENIAGAEMHVIADASHMAPLEKPDGINAPLGNFLQRHARLDIMGSGEQAARWSADLLSFVPEVLEEFRDLARPDTAA